MSKSLDIIYDLFVAPISNIDKFKVSQLEKKVELLEHEVNHLKECLDLHTKSLDTLSELYIYLHDLRSR